MPKGMVGTARCKFIGDGVKKIILRQNGTSVIISPHHRARAFLDMSRSR